MSDITVVFEEVALTTTLEEVAFNIDLGETGPPGDDGAAGATGAAGSAGPTGPPGDLNSNSTVDGGFY